jgi:hypothetical protein
MLYSHSGPGLLYFWLLASEGLVVFGDVLALWTLRHRGLVVSGYLVSGIGPGLVVVYV